MKSEDFERLLYEEESPTLDFKRDQYTFAKATEVEKSELLKDILGFVNCWRRAEALILIGVEEVQGGKSIVHGVSEHLPDHSLQQFVNNLTNRPVQFGYEAFDFEGKQVGIIKVERQRRPVFLKQHYGKLQKGQVYVRRGSSTDPTKPADPDEISLMGSDFTDNEREVSIAVAFAENDRDQELGDTIEIIAERCSMPAEEKIPNLREGTHKIHLGDRSIEIPHLGNITTQLNCNFFCEVARYTIVERLYRKLRLVVKNTGSVAATDVRVELCVEPGEGYLFYDAWDMPDKPVQREHMAAAVHRQIGKHRPLVQFSGRVDVQTNEHGASVEIECGNIQPGRNVWAEAFYIGVAESDHYEIEGKIFAANLSKPQTFCLNVNATITQTAMSVDELVKLGRSFDEGDE